LHVCLKILKAFHNTLDEIQTAINAVIAALTDEYVVAFHYVLWRVVFMLCIAPMKTVLESLYSSLLIGPALREAGLLMLGSPLHKVINNLTAEFLRAELIERSEMLIEFLAHDTPREFDREAEAFMKLPTTLTLPPDERLRQLANHLMGLTASLFSSSRGKLHRRSPLVHRRKVRRGARPARARSDRRRRRRRLPARQTRPHGPHQRPQGQPGHLPRVSPLSTRVHSLSLCPFFTSGLAIIK
jgi:hypothetical protein